jgi:hypothetical protein
MANCEDHNRPALADTIPIDQARPSKRPGWSPNAVRLCIDEQGGVFAQFPKAWWFALIAFALGGGAGGNVLARFAVIGDCDAVKVEQQRLATEVQRAEIERALNTAAIVTLTKGLEDLKAGQERLSSKVDDSQKSLNRIVGWIYKDTK